MRKFKDNSGRTWRVEINVAQVGKVRADLHLNLYAAFEGNMELYRRITSDPVEMVQVLYSLCEAQAEQQKVIAEDFGRAMGGDVLRSAHDALTEELIDFFPDPRRRGTIRTLLQKSQKLADLAIQMGQEMATAINPKSPGLISKMLSGNTPES